MMLEILVLLIFLLYRSPSSQFVDFFRVFTMLAELHVGTVKLVDGELEEN